MIKSLKQTLQSHIAVIIFAIVLSILGLWLYASTANLLLFWDDVPHMFWLASQSNGAYWLTSEGFPFYRPATFTIWELFETIWGYHNPQALHILSISLHIINAVLVAGLGAKLSRNFRAGLWAGIIFIAFPFSYQTVIPTAAHFHLWLLFGILSSSWLLLNWLEHPNSRCRLFASWIFAFWAIFSHENGILTPILIGGLLLIYQWTHLHLDWRLFRKHMIVAITPIAILAMIYGFMWATVPKANETTGLELNALDVKIGQTLQAIGYPIVILFEKLNVQESNIFLTWLSGGIIIGITLIWRIWHWKNHKQLENTHYLAIISLIWIPTVMLPAWALLDVNYLLGSPRLHYLASVGIAWLWGSWLSSPLPLPSQAPNSIRLQWLAGIIGVGICLLTSIPFIQGRVDQHHTIDDIYRDIGAFAESMDTQDRLLVVNAPAYIAPRQKTFLLGAEGSTYLPDFIGLGDWLILNRFQKSGFTADNRRADDIIPQTDDVFAVTHPPIDRSTIQNYNRVVVVTNVDQIPTALLSGDQILTPPTQTPLGIFDHGLVLSTAKLHPMGHKNPKRLLLELEWIVQERENVPTAIFVHLVCDGRLIAQADGPPLGRLYPLDQWQFDEIWRDYRYFTLNEAYPTECLQVLVGLYDPTTNTRQTVTLTDDTTSDSITIDYSAQ